MKTVFLLILVVVLFAPCGQVAFAGVPPTAQDQGQPPVSEKELEMMLAVKGGMTAQQIADIVRERGISFRVDDAKRKSLKKAGANDVVLAALDKAYAELKRGTVEAKAAGITSTLSAIPAPPPPPLDDRAAAELIEQARQNALAYTDHLPNFLCLQVTKRMYDRGDKGYWQTQDTIHARVSYNDRHETYEVYMVGDRAVANKRMESLGGASSSGEFGSLLREIFLPESQTRFTMNAPAQLRGRPVYVYDYRVDQPHSQWQLVWEPGAADERQMTPGYNGSVIIDAETHQVLRVWLVANSIPPDFPIQSAMTNLDYDWAKIGEQPYLLPASAIMEMKDNQAVHTRNEIAFRGYRRFSAEAVLKFGDIPDEPPATPEPAGKVTTPPTVGQPPAGKKK